MAIHIKPEHQKIARQLIATSAVCLLLIFALNALTKEKVHNNKTAFLRASLEKVLPKSLSLAHFDNDVLASKYRSDELTVYPACQGGQLRYALIEVSTDKGYSGTIQLLVNVDIQQAKVVALRPLFHLETPGLGDQIDTDKSDWLQQFILPLNTEKTLRVDKDGGDIDAITGATITSRAVSNLLNETVFSLNTQTIERLCHYETEN